MKRIVRSFGLILMISIILSGCSFTDNQYTNEPVDTTTLSDNTIVVTSAEEYIDETMSTANTCSETTDTTIEDNLQYELVLWDDAYVEVVCNELVIDEYLGAQLWLTVTNKTEQTLRVKACDTVISNYLFTTFYQPVIEPYATCRASIRFLATDLLVAGINDIDEIQFHLVIEDGNTYIDIVKTPTIEIQFETVETS